MSSQSSNVQTTQYQLKLMTNSVLATVQLFGFNLKLNEKEYKIQFNATMFNRPNQKAFEVIVHFLLCQIDPEKAEKMFSQCWPIILKEQNKEFKDVVFNWLLEIAQKSPANSKQEKHHQNNQLVQQYQNLLNFIRFPIITKSLLMTPGGLKVCELLSALSQYALIINLARLIETNKLNLRIPPKISPFFNFESGKQPFSQTPTLNMNNSNSKFVTQKQLIDFKRLTNLTKNRLNLELDEFFQLITKILETRTKWQQNAQIKTNQIRALVDKKINLTQSIACKKALLAKQLNIKENNDENVSLETLYTEFKSTKLNQFENLWLEFRKINKDSFENEFNKENIDCLFEKNSDLTQKLKIDGQKFIRPILEDQSNEGFSLEKFEEKIHKFIYENSDTNSTIRNAEVGTLFLQDGKQLDFINLVRLFNLVLISNAELMSKIDNEKLNIFTELLKSMTANDENELISIDESSECMKLSGFFDANKAVNEDSLRLKKQLDAILPKLNESYRALVEKEVVNLKIPISPIKDEMTLKVKEFMKEYFNLRKTSIDSRLLKILRQNRELAMGENIHSDFKENSDQINDIKINSEQNEGNQHKKKSVKFCLDFEEKKQDENEFQNSFEILDLKDRAAMSDLTNKLRKCVDELDIDTFDFNLNSHIKQIIDLKPNILNEIVTKCLNIKGSSYPNGCDFLELFMHKLGLSELKYITCDVSSKPIVNMYLLNKRKFSNSSVYFLFRCNDLNLINQVVQSELLDSLTTCENWHLMFVTSYQERFFNPHFTNTFEGFMVKYILICKLKCSLIYRRPCLTWFAGSMHLYTDEYFLQNEEKRLKYSLYKLFEALILNGLLQKIEYQSLIKMLNNRNEEIQQSLSQKNLFGNQANLKQDKEKNFNFPSLNCLFPLSLKNMCRIAIKRDLKHYSSHEIQQLYLPDSLKKFVYFEDECSALYRNFEKNLST